MRTASWIMMLAVQIPVFVITVWLFYRIMHDDNKKEGKKE